MSKHPAEKQGSSNPAKHESELLDQDLEKVSGGAAPGLFEIEDFSFDIEQTLNIGSQSTGAGAGRVRTKK